MVHNFCTNQTSELCIFYFRRWVVGKCTILKLGLLAPYGGSGSFRLEIGVCDNLTEMARHTGRGHLVADFARRPLHPGTDWGCVHLRSVLWCDRGFGPLPSLRRVDAGTDVASGGGARLPGPSTSAPPAVGAGDPGR